MLVSQNQPLDKFTKCSKASLQNAMSSTKKYIEVDLGVTSNTHKLNCWVFVSTQKE